MSAMSLRQAAGQVLVVGLEGAQLSAMEAAWLRLLRPEVAVVVLGRSVEARERKPILPPDLLARYQKDAFWEDLKQLPPTVKLV